MDTLEEMEEKSEAADVEAELLARKARIKELKKQYGSDWPRMAKQLLGGFKGMLHEPPGMRRDG